MAITTYIPQAHNRAVRQASELPEEQNPERIPKESRTTDRDGNITQHTAYLPYGELLVDEHSSSEDMPYKFNGKEFDEETGLYYYGARYMNPVASIWYGIDSKFEKYPSLSGYCITSANPIILKDIDGNDIVLVGTKNSSVKIKTDLLNCRVSIADYGVDFRGNFTFNGDELVSAALDIVGIVDPSGAADVANACLQFKNKDYLGATISGIGLVPYAGDAAKIFKVGKRYKNYKKSYICNSTKQNHRKERRKTSNCTNPKTIW